ncbi:hypothetical protein BON30_47420 [Cystobacter ferrugineus]|uniref:Uncharacterized protein n=1 Tax=Cystobacter ferrugineus TaxID=83449 RepID=A0A1L9AUI5_9BACT|nr:hypothetical protein BON30_47420 [Cystobacter ferrugineus]
MRRRASSRVVVYAARERTKQTSRSRLKLTQKVRERSPCRTSFTTRGLSRSPQRAPSPVSTAMQSLPGVPFYPV